MRGLMMGGLALLALTLASCGTPNVNDVADGSGTPQGTAPPHETMPGNLPTYPDAQRQSIRHSATFTTNDALAQVTEFYTTAAERAGYALVRRNDDSANAVRLVFLIPNQSGRLHVDAQRRTDGVTAVQIRIQSPS